MAQPVPEQITVADDVLFEEYGKDCRVSPPPKKLSDTLKRESVVATQSVAWLAKICCVIVLLCAMPFTV